MKDMLSQYLPIQNGSITVIVEANNPTSAVTNSQFTVTTYWDMDGYNNGIRKIDYEQFDQVTIQGGDIMIVSMLERYEHLYPICGGKNGPLSLTFNFRNSLSYPNDYIQLSLYNSFTVPGALLCYFNNPSVPKEIKIKTFRCDYSTANGGSIQIFVPEELQTLNAGQDYEVVIDSRGVNEDSDGLLAMAPSNVYWIVVSHSKPLEVT